MDINIYINRKKINPLCMKGIDEYIKRLTPYCRLSVMPAPLKKTGGRNSMDIAVACGADSRSGEYADVSSEKFADMIGGAATTGISSINFYTGQSESGIRGMTKLCLCTLSVSEDMEALMLSEQIYRAFTILNHITYHK